MKRVHRIMSGAIRKFEKTGSGGVRLEAAATRVGVFPYLLADGSIRHELRPPEEVFRPDSLETMRGIAVTDGHPPGMVDPSNWGEHAIGHVGDSAQPEEQTGHVLTNAIISDADAIRKIDEGERNEVSMGYDVDLDETPGEWNGEKYDAVQRNMTYNHLAILPKGEARGGSSVALRLDAGFCIVDERGAEMATEIVKVRFDGTEYIQGSREHVEALETKLATESKRADDEHARADKAHDPKTIHAAAAKRARLIALAVKHVAKFDADDPAAVEMGEDKIVGQIIAALAPNLDTSGWSPGEMLAAVAALASQNAVSAPAPVDSSSLTAPKAPGLYDSASRVRETALIAVPDPKRKTIEQARADAIEKNQNRWRAGLERKGN